MRRALAMLLTVISYAGIAVAIYVTGMALVLKLEKPATVKLQMWSIGISAVLAIAAGIGAYKLWALNWRRRLVHQGLFAMAVVLVFGVTGRNFMSAESAHTFICARYVSELVGGLHLYAADNDETYPPASSWRTLTDSRLATSPHICDYGKSKWHYGFNAALSSISLSSVEDPQRTVAIFETEAEAPNAHGGESQMAMRHTGGWCYVGPASGGAGKQTRLLKPGWLRWKP